MMKWGSFAASLVLFATCFPPAFAATTDLGGGFQDHGVCVPISFRRGTVATVDGNGKNVGLAWLMDHRGAYSLLLLNVTDGKCEQYPLPFPPAGETVDSPYTSLLSSANKFYVLNNYHLAEFDPVTRSYTFCSPKTSPRFAMAMTEDDAGKIWAVNFPQCGLVSFDPKSREFKDYGEVYKQNWNEYPTSLAADDAGWIYFGIGHTASQIIAFDPSAGKATPLLPDADRKRGQAYVYRDRDGKVYAQALKDVKGDDAKADKPNEWHELYKGQMRSIGLRESWNPKPIVTGNQNLFKNDFPDGSKIKDWNLVDRVATITLADGSEKQIKFEYESDGAPIESVIDTPQGQLAGGTTFPMRFYSYDPVADTMIDRPAFGQWNTVTRERDHVFVGAYPEGYLLDWDTTKPWVNTSKNVGDSNPKYLMQYVHTHRPHRVMALADGETVLMGGTPEYGATGGGLVIWNRKQNNGVTLGNDQLLKDLSVVSMVPLGGENVLLGFTTAPGTGGEKKAAQAELATMSLATRTIDWHSATFPGAEEYTDLCAGPNGLIYGMLDRKTFFVFDPVSKSVTQQETSAEFGETGSGQGTHVLVRGDNAVYILFRHNICTVDPSTHKVSLIAKSPITIENGGAVSNGRLYFINESHLYSFELPK